VSGAAKETEGRLLSTFLHEWFATISCLVKRQALPPALVVYHMMHDHLRGLIVWEWHDLRKPLCNGGIISSQNAPWADWLSCLWPCMPGRTLHERFDWSFKLKLSCLDAILLLLANLHFVHNIVCVIVFFISCLSRVTIINFVEKLITRVQ
jgi:hypothetical protein